MTIKERDELTIRLDERVDAILLEVKKTNGRVTVLEDAKNRMVGAMVATGTLGAIVGALIGYALTYYSK